jgi:hypothetical protein
VARQKRTDRFDSGDGALVESPLAESRLHGATDIPPRRLAYLAVDPAVGDDFDVLVGQQHIDQNAAVVLGVPDPEAAEYLERTASGKARRAV